ncbi:hypothetical protein LSTR_LSTR006720 [Laodelphax striatellus]|uniref:Uncharacterized protein n=1 Tax=Laodelphax striatellus TaxID=195883 RepID=A0A482XU67_LAOST|nr:hypothetical protein LSTR_LSTR006720 [Laodelphax striatellus]
MSRVCGVLTPRRRKFPIVGLWLLAAAAAFVSCDATTNVDKIPLVKELGLQSGSDKIRTTGVVYLIDIAISDLRDTSDEIA